MTSGYVLRNRATGEYLDKNLFATNDLSKARIYNTRQSATLSLDGASRKYYDALPVLVRVTLAPEGVDA